MDSSLETPFIRLLNPKSKIQNLKSTIEGIMGKILALLIVLIVIGSVYTFVSGHWWFPVGISEHAGAIDAQG